MRTETSPDALLVDFNGTLSDDELILWQVYAALFEEAGHTLTEARYRTEFAGLSDEEMFVREFGLDADIAALTQERVRRYIDCAAGGSTVDPSVRAAFEAAAKHVRIALVTSAWRVEVDAVIQSAGLADVFQVRVCAEDVTRLKPDPEAYLLACQRLGVEPGSAVAIEDSAAGVAAAKAAGLRCAAVTTTMPASRLGEADLLFERVDAAVDALLGL